MLSLSSFISVQDRHLERGQDRVRQEDLFLLVLQLGEELALCLGDLGLPGGQADLGSIPPLLGDGLLHLRLGRGVLADGSVALKEQSEAT